jgi:hypothetical protein
MLFRKNLISTAALIRGMSGESLSAVGSTYCINKGILRPRSDDVHQICWKVSGLHNAVVIRTKAYEVFELSCSFQIGELLNAMFEN